MGWNAKENGMFWLWPREMQSQTANSISKIRSFLEGILSIALMLEQIQLEATMLRHSLFPPKQRKEMNPKKGGEKRREHSFSTYGGVRKTMPKTLFSSSFDTDMTSAPVFLCLKSTAFDLHSPINSSETFSNPSFSANSSWAPANSAHNNNNKQPQTHFISNSSQTSNFCKI